jgi:UDP-glucose-4-epimerase GalE
VVFSSTCSVYGVPEKLPIDESHPLRPINPYGQTKMAVERCLEDYGRAYGLKSVSLRYFNAAGADPDGEIGEERAQETHLIPLALGAALGRRRGLTIFGDRHATPDGTCIRDYVHVTDLASAHVSALRHLDTCDGTCAFNLGSGVGTSVSEIVFAVQELSGRSFPVCRGEPRPGDPPSLVASIARARTQLGWRPVLSDTATILRTAWSWLETRT